MCTCVTLHTYTHTHTQGLTSFYMTNAGEEAAQYGSSAGMDPEDMLYLQYREVGVLMWRGFTVQQCMDQCFSNWKDLTKGRQMPVHYGSKELNVQFVSSPLATQMPQGELLAWTLGGDCGQMPHAHSLKTR